MGTLWCLPNENTDLLDDERPTLTELLQLEGYVTCAVDNLAGMAFHPKWFTRGYDYYINPSPHPRKGKLRAERVNRFALPWIEQHANTKESFFLFLHYWDAHAPYEPPAPFNAFFKPTTDDAPQPYALRDGARFIPRWGRGERMTEKALQTTAYYDGAIRYADDQVGRALETLKRLGVYDETLIVVNADHGENMMEHNAHFEHRECYDTTIRVPLIVKLPRALQSSANRGAVVEALVGHVDLTPTILDLVGAREIPPSDGVSLKPILTGAGGETHETICSTGYWVWDTNQWKSAEMSARTRKWKCLERADVAKLAPGPKPPIGFYHRKYEEFLRLPKRELYDLENDSDEQVNLAEDEPDVAGQMRARLLPWLESGKMAGR